MTNNFGFRPGPTKNQPIQSQKQARSLKFQIYQEEGLYLLCSENGENKDDNQLCSYCTADLHLCFRICRLLDFLCGDSNNVADQDQVPRPRQKL